ncbi:unnamed protein product [marine sediment metagenome]|uniref:Uncharacterized protein n=1 Tax=marine sediment metagenome TaxID=412755 RepID=X0VA08_9ZZZZ
MKITCKDLILKKLELVHRYLAVHEFDLTGYSENNLASRLPELAKAGKVIGRYRKGQSYKEWGLIGSDGQAQLI